MNLEKTNGSLSAGIPIPVSFTAMQKTAWPPTVSASETRNPTEPVFGELDRVPQEVQDHLPYSAGVAQNPPARRGRLEGVGQTLGSGLWSHQVAHFRQAAGDIERRSSDFQAPGLDFGEIENVVDHHQ